MSWHTIHFGEIAEFRNGLNYSRENFGTGLKVISVADFGTRWTPDIQSLSEINPDGVAKPEDHLDDGDLLFVRSNGNRDLVGRVMLVQYLSGAKVGFSGFCIRARLKNSHCNPAFYAYLFRSPKTRQLMTAGGVGASISNVSQKTLAKLIVPLPSRAEQDAVVDTLQSYDDLIAINQRRIALLEDAARRLYREWFVQLRFPGHESVAVKDGVPQGWRRLSLTDVADFVNGFAFKPEHQQQTGLPIIKIPELRDGVSSKTPRSFDLAVPARNHIDMGDVLFSWSATLLVNEWSDGPALLNQHLFKVVPNNVTHKRLIRFAVEAAIPTLLGQSVGATMQHIRRSALDAHQILVPTQATVDAFAELVDPMMDLVLNLHAQIRQLTSSRDLLLPKLMSGQLDVSTIALPDEVAA